MNKGVDRSLLFRFHISSFPLYVLVEDGTILHERNDTEQSVRFRLLNDFSIPNWKVFRVLII